MIRTFFNVKVTREQKTNTETSEFFLSKTDQLNPNIIIIVHYVLGWQTERRHSYSFRPNRNVIQRPDKEGKLRS